MKEIFEEYLKSPEGLKLLTEILKDNLTVLITSHSVPEHNREFTYVSVNVIFNDEHITFDTTIF